MDWLVLICLGIGIGAVIGGLTNTLAIYMLFRPYREYRLGKWTLPFTPGLIPKRQEEIASQLGKLVAQHLLSVEALQERLNEVLLHEDTRHSLQKKVMKYMESEETCLAVLERYLPYDAEHTLEKIDSFLRDAMQDKLHAWWGEYKDKSMDQLIEFNQSWISEKVELVAEYFLHKGKDFLYTLEGKNMLYEFIQRGLEQQGALGNMLGIFVSKDKLIERIRPVLLQWLANPTTKQKVLEKLEELLEEIGQKKISELISPDQKEKLLECLSIQIGRKMSISTLLKKPLHEILAPWKGEIEKLLSGLLTTISKYLNERIPDLYQHLKVADMVKQQVVSFPLPRLEQMVKELARKELAMITWLGALLGGLIGALQSIIYLVFYLYF